MSTRAAWLVLFDIDGTLINSGRAGLRGMDRAFRRIYRRPDALEGVGFAGRTDRAIVADALARIGVAATDPEITRFRAAYLDDLREEIAVPVAGPQGVLPGVHALLDGLGARPDVAVGLLTGNFEGGAAIKLGHFALWERFAFGAFGDAHLDRRDLMPVAVARAAGAGIRVPASRIVVIGDTPLDVDCARAHGARAVAVATGPFDRAALEAAGPDLVVDTLADAGDPAGWFD